MNVESSWELCWIAFIHISRVGLSHKRWHKWLHPLFKVINMKKLRPTKSNRKCGEHRPLQTLLTIAFFNYQLHLETRINSKRGTLHNINNKKCYRTAFVGNFYVAPRKLKWFEELSIFNSLWWLQYWCKTPEGNSGRIYSFVLTALEICRVSIIKFLTWIAWENG